MKQAAPWVLFLSILLLAGGLVAHARRVLRIEEMAPPGRRADPPSSPAALPASRAMDRVPSLPDGPAATEAILGTLVESCMRLKERRLTARALAAEMGTIQEPLLPPDPGERPPMSFAFKPHNPYFKAGDVGRRRTTDHWPTDTPASVFLTLRDPRHLTASKLEKALGKAARPWVFTHEPEPLPMFFEWRKQPKMGTKARCGVMAELGWGAKFGVKEEVITGFDVSVERDE